MLVMMSARGSVYLCIHGVEDTTSALHDRVCVDCRYEASLQSERYYTARAEKAVDEAWERFK